MELKLHQMFKLTHAYAKFMTRRDRALATILCCLLKDGESVQNHVKVMTEIFDGLSVIGDPVEEEDRVVHLLASLPEFFDMLVTALEANIDVPKMDVVTERLLHEERKMKGRDVLNRVVKKL